MKSSEAVSLHVVRGREGRMGVLLKRSMEMRSLLGRVRGFRPPPGIWGDVARALDDAIVGSIEVRPPESGACGGAWEVHASVGPGWGREVYELGYWLSPSGRLVADRETISGDAVRGWTRLHRRVEGEPLDDVRSPRNSDPNDDCLLWPTGEDGHVGDVNYNPEDTLPPEEGDAVNRVYQVTPRWDYDTMEEKGRELTRGMTPDDRRRWDSELSSAVGRFFEKHFASLFTLMREYVRSVLREHVESDLGIVKFPDMDGVSAIIVRRSALTPRSSDFNELLGAILATCYVHKPFHPCNGAWEVGGSSGDGKLAYDAAYWLSPSNQLIADRFSVSRSAARSWTRWNQKSPGQPLDDVRAPRNSDPNDDCELYVGEEGVTLGQQNTRAYDHVPPEAADALNRSHHKTPQFDWTSIERNSKDLFSGFKRDALSSAALEHFKEALNGTKNNY